MHVKKSKNLICIRMEEGEDFFENVHEVVKRFKLKSGIILHAIGQFKDVELAFYDRKRKKYSVKKFKGPFEVVSLTGNVSFFEKQVVVHTHTVLGKKNFGVIAGHLNKATVVSTLEMFILTTPLSFKRKLDELSGLKLLNFQKGKS